MTLREIFLAKFSPKLLALKAFVYQRQSSLKQLEENTGSTMYQRDLVKIALEIGFAPENIEIIDCDTGRSGEAIEHREGFQYLLDNIKHGRAGLVEVGDLSRANRNAKDQFELFEHCKIFEVALWYDERFHDPSDINELLAMQMTAVVNENQNLRSRSNLLKGRYTRAKHGEVASSLPRGFVNVGHCIEKDPDPAVQESILRVIREFWKHRKIRPTWLALLADGVQLPIRKKQRLRWVKPTQAAVRYILTNPIYGSRYYFRRFVSDPRLGRDRLGHWRTRPARPDEIMSTPAVFDAYMTWEEYLEIQTILGTHLRKPGRPHSTNGPALCQGLLFCATHPRYVMSPKPRSGRRSHPEPESWVYRCAGTHPEGGRQCVTVAAVYIDPYVTEAILRRVTPPRLEILRAAYDRAKRGELSEKYRLQTEVERLSARVHRLAYLYESEDPTNSAVRRKLAEEWDSAIRQEEHLRNTLGSARSTKTVFDDDAAFTEFAALCQNVRSLFAAATILERKEITRCLIEKVILEACTPATLQLRVVWNDGTAPELIEVSRWGLALSLIEEWDLAGLSVEETTRRLNEIAIINRKHRPYTANSVAHARWRLRVKRGEKKAGLAATAVRSGADPMR